MSEIALNALIGACDLLEPKLRLFSPNESRDKQCLDTVRTWARNPQSSIDAVRRWTKLDGAASDAAAWCAVAALAAYHNDSQAFTSALADVKKWTELHG